MILYLLLISATVKLAYDPSPSPEVTGYKIYSSFEGAPYQMVANVPANILEVTVQIKPAAKYEFYATAYDETAESDHSNHVTFVRQPTLAIRSWQDGPFRQFEISTEVYAGLNWILEATRNFTSWQTVATGTAAFDALVIPFNAPVNEPKMFYRLKKNVTQLQTLARSVADMSLEELVNVEVQTPIEPLSYRKSTWWERTKHRFRYRPGHSPQILKGGERQIQMLKPTPKPELPMPPMPFQIKESE